jgi:hypothetical protein
MGEAIATEEQTFQDYGALRVASGSFCRLTDGCQPVSFRRVRSCRRIRSDQLMGQSAPPSFRGRHGRTCFDTRRGGPAARPRQTVAVIGARPHHRGDGCSPVTGRQDGRPWRVLWAITCHGRHRPHRFENEPSLRPSRSAARRRSASLSAHILRYSFPVNASGPCLSLEMHLQLAR